MDDIARRIASLSAHKRMLLSKLLKDASYAPEPAPHTTMAAAATGSPLVLLKTGSKRPFFCVHPVGGGVACYTGLARHFDVDRPFYAFQALRPQDDGSSDGLIEHMSANYLDAIRQAQPHGPYLLSGWSAGGIIAYEMARQLRARGEPVGLLALIDSSLLPLPWEWLTGGANGEVSARLIFRFVADLGLPPDQLADSLDRVRSLPPDEQLQHIVERAIADGLLPYSIDRAEIAQSFATFKLNMLALSKYRPHPADLRIILFTAAENNLASPRAGYSHGPSFDQIGDDQTLGWSKLARGGVETYKVPGNHYTIMREPLVRVLAGRLTSSLSLMD